jgi:hypothetical protein
MVKVIQRAITSIRSTKDIFLFGLVISSFSSPCQSLDSLGSAAYILNANAYKKGVYRTFEEFKYNQPSIVDDYVVGKKAIWVTNKNNGRHKKLKNDETWGYSDGARIFVKRNKFNELVEKGRYCYFKERGTRFFYAITPIPFMIVPIPTPYEDELIINFNTGHRYRLTKKLMKEILEADDHELLAMFQVERNKAKKFYDYIVKYNERNAARIK